MELIWQTVVNAWVAVSLYAVVAVGLALILGVMHTVNYAHGEFFMVGAYTVWLLYSRGDLPFFVAVLAGAAVAAVVGLITERAVFRYLRGNIVAGAVASLGLVFILQVAVGQAWGVGVSKPVPPAFTGALEIFGARVGWQRFIVIPISMGMLGGLWFFLHRVKLGRALRAMTQDPEAAALQGISINRMALLAMAIAAALAGAAGGLMSSIYLVTPYMGGAVILMSLIIVIVGGAGSLEGAVLAAIIFGFLHTIVTTLLDSTVANIIAALVMGVMLAVRPEGLLGREQI